MFKDTVKNVNTRKYVSTPSADTTNALHYSIYSNDSRLPHQQGLFPV